MPNPQDIYTPHTDLPPCGVAVTETDMARWFGRGSMPALRDAQPEKESPRVNPSEDEDNLKADFLPGSFSKQYVTKDSGSREEMPTGSVRDSREGKGRFDLISPFALARLAGVYERGAKKYADRNWEKGQPFSRFLDSAMRHLNRFAMGWDDEDHLAQAAWNLFAIMHFEELERTELDDMPHSRTGPA